MPARNRPAARRDREPAAGRAADQAVPRHSAHPPRRTARVRCRVRCGLAGAALLGGGLLTGCLAQGSMRTETRQLSFTHRVDRIVVDLASGNLTVQPGRAGTVAIDRTLAWTDRRPTVSETWQGNVLRISGRCGGRSCASDYTVRLPASAAIEAHTGSGTISTTAIEGDQALTADAGSIEVTRAFGRLSATAHSGDVIGMALSAAHTEATADNGRISLGYAAVPRAVVASAGSGNVAVAVPPAGPGYRIEAATGSGATHVEVPDATGSPDSITADTVSGDVAIRFV